MAAPAHILTSAGLASPAGCVGILKTKPKRRSWDVGLWQVVWGRAGVCGSSAVTQHGAACWRHCHWYTHVCLWVHVQQLFRLQAVPRAGVSHMHGLLFHFWAHCGEKYLSTAVRRHVDFYTVSAYPCLAHAGDAALLHRACSTAASPITWLWCFHNWTSDVAAGQRTHSGLKLLTTAAMHCVYMHALTWRHLCAVHWPCFAWQAWCGCACGCGVA